MRATLAQMHKAKQETEIMIRRLICDFLPGKFDCDDWDELIAAENPACPPQELIEKNVRRMITLARNSVKRNPPWTGFQKGLHNILRIAHGPSNCEFRRYLKNRASRVRLEQHQP
jgi:hypothetical protein